jgi:hypothetical protein
VGPNQTQAGALEEIAKVKGNQTSGTYVKPTDTTAVTAVQTTKGKTKPKPEVTYKAPA